MIKNAQFWIVRCFGIISLVALLFWVLLRDSDLRRNGIFVVGKVTKLGNGPRSAKVVTYTFVFEGKEYVKEQLVPSDTKDEILGWYFSVAVLPENPNNSRIFLEKKIYKINSTGDESISP